MSSLLMMVNGPQLPTTTAGWAVIGAIVVIATVVPVVAFLAGLARIGPTNAAMISTLEPVVTWGWPRCCWGRLSSRSRCGRRVDPGGRAAAGA